jgi:hypothetical protein
MLFIPLIDDLDGEYGLWTRPQLIEMDQKFVAAVERAFANGGESPVAARATVDVKASLNGSRRLAAEAAIEAAWLWLRGKMDESVDVAFVEVVEFVNARCSGVPASKVRAEFEKRFARDGSWKEAPVGVKEDTAEEQVAGRRRLAREQMEKTELEIQAGRRREARTRERFELEQAAGRRAAAKFG